MKFNRAYELSITPNINQPPINLFDESETDLINKYQTNQFTISHPFISNGAISNGVGINFTVERGINVTNNQASIEIFNLNSFARKFLTQDIFTPPRVEKKDENGNVILNDKKKPKMTYNYRYVNLSIGYMGTDNQKKIFDRIFVGNLMEGGSGRQGTEIITKLHCLENGYFINSNDGLVNQGIQKDTTLLDFIKICLEKLGMNANQLEIPNKSTEQAVKTTKLREQTLIGDGLTLLRGQFGLNFFIDNGKAYILNDDEAIQDAVVPVINSSTGLIGTPFIKGQVIELRTICDPRFKLGFGVQLESSVIPEYNGQYKIIGIKHQGEISPSSKADLITTLQLFRGVKLLT